MKEYIAETGGRYTYSDDILNLQELSLSMTSIFEDCSDFIISGCRIEGTEISSGYVWLNGKVRYFGGTKEATFPYYIYEKNNYDTVTYANEVNKTGRCNYLCEAGPVTPAIEDPVTKRLPQFIEITVSSAPRFIDKFIGKYAVLLDTPFSKQTIKKEMVFAGKVTGDKEIQSKTAISVANPTNGYELTNVVKANGDASIGAYVNGLLVNEIVISKGVFYFYKQGKEIARVDESGINYYHSSTKTTQAGSIYIKGNNLTNPADNTDEGGISLNTTGYNHGNTKYRNFQVYNGKNSVTPILQVVGKTGTVILNGLLSVRNEGKGIDLVHSTMLKNDAQLVNSIKYKDSSLETIATVGFDKEDDFSFYIQNTLGDVVVIPKQAMNVKGDLKVNGTSISSTYVKKDDFQEELKKKVDAVSGKKLSSEDFTATYKNKLDSITKGKIEAANEGYVVGKDAFKSLSEKLGINSNLSDLNNPGTARENLKVYSKEETNSRFLKINSNLLELVTLTADEVNGLTTEQIAQKKEEKQATVRNTINAEKKGAADSRLAKTSNLSDLGDKAKARANIGVYSTSEIDELLKGKLSSSSGYVGDVFTTEHKTKLEGIKTGNFTYFDNEGASVPQSEGYALVSGITKELEKKANRFLDGYTSDQKKTISVNLGLYSKAEVDAKFVSAEGLLQEYISHLVKQGKTVKEAQQILRDKLNTISKEDVTQNYIRKDGKLNDLVLANDDERKTVCRKIGAAYASEYQAKILDTGWIQMVNSGTATNTTNLFIRQIGNIVCIQGTINTASKDGEWWGGVVAIIPNQIPPPKYGLRNSYTDYNKNTKNNRGCSYIIRANSRSVIQYESGWAGVVTEINFTYMT